MRAVVLASCDATAREVAGMSIGCGAAGVLEVRHDLVVGPDGSGQVQGTASDLGGVVQVQRVELDHGCVSCTVREALVPLLAWVVEQGRWRDVLVSLPVTAPPDAVAWQLDEAIHDGRLAGLVLAGVVTALDATTVLDDLMGDDLLSERGLQLSGHDQRAVGEALSLQLDASDLVLCLERPDERSSALLDHVMAPGVARVDGLDALDVDALFAGRHDLAAAHWRMAPEHRSARTCRQDHGVWTLELHSPHAFHPARLLDQVELLGSGRLRSRGCFWLPSRPGTVCVWDGSGGQLSIGEAGPWRGEAMTHLVVTGIDEGDRGRVERAFDDVLLTGHEQPRAVQQWAGRPDGLEAWLGEVD